MTYLPVRRLETTLTANRTKVILRRRNLSIPIRDFIEKFEKLKTDERSSEWERTKSLFEGRHRDFEERLIAICDAVEDEVGHALNIHEDDRKLLGAYFAMEYSIEAAALFNPSIVPHWEIDESKDAFRFVLSLRTVGEGHISSICFIDGIFDEQNGVALNDTTDWRSTGKIEHVTDRLYHTKFDKSIPLRERVLFPQTPAESNGMEDLRLVKFIDENGSSTYYGTYTAYDGKKITSKLLETTDFVEFAVKELRGDAVEGKGIALFPRKVNGKYCAIGRQDGFSLTLMYSDEADIWEEKEPLLAPSSVFDLTQMGNCGSPIETSKGWLLPTHGVGPMRRYTLGLALLDLEDPSIVLSYLSFPLMEPTEQEREGYVPNVLYSCGMIAHNSQLLIPYAMSDTSCGFATCSIDRVLEALTNRV